MINKKEGKIKINLSPTSLNTYYQSPLLFYLKYIAKVPDDTYVPVCYGLSGNIVHKCLEKYAKKEITKDQAFMLLSSQWIEKNLSQHKNINNKPLDQEEYLKALIKGIQIVDEHKNHICEEIIQMPFLENDSLQIGFKGIIDLQATQKSDNGNIIIDYKTSNNVNQGKDFERQALFYNFLIHKKKNSIPDKTVFHYLKLNKPMEYKYSKDEINIFEEELNSIAREILNCGIEIGNYPIGNVNDIFNSKRRACEEEVKRRSGYENIKTFVQMRF